MAILIYSRWEIVFLTNALQLMLPAWVPLVWKNEWIWAFPPQIQLQQPPDSRTVNGKVLEFSGLSFEGHEVQAAPRPQRTTIPDGISLTRTRSGPLSLPTADRQKDTNCAQQETCQHLVQRLCCVRAPHRQELPEETEFIEPLRAELFSGLCFAQGHQQGQITLVETHYYSSAEHWQSQFQRAGLRSEVTEKIERFLHSWLHWQRFLLRTFLAGAEPSPPARPKPRFTCCHKHVSSDTRLNSWTLPARLQLIDQKVQPYSRIAHHTPSVQVQNLIDLPKIPLDTSHLCSHLLAPRRELEKKRKRDRWLTWRETDTLFLWNAEQHRHIWNVTLILGPVTCLHGLLYRILDSISSPGSVNNHFLSLHCNFLSQ